MRRIPDRDQEEKAWDAKPEEEAQGAKTVVVPLLADEEEDLGVVASEYRGSNDDRCTEDEAGRGGDIGVRWRDQS